MKKNKHVVVSLSGGLDSSTLLLRCLSEYKSVTALSFDYGQKHRVELERAQSLVDYINETQYTNQRAPGLLQGPKGDEKKITYRQIKLDGLVDLLDSTLVTGGDEVPEGHYAEENMKATVVPNRNKIFASITQAVALSITSRTGEGCDIALGIHSGDHSVYPDTTEEFRQADLHAFRVGNWDADKVGFFAPYMEGDKFTILQDGEVLCEELGLGFDEVYSRTMTSYKPIFIPGEGNLWVEYNPPKDGVVAERGNWFSDFKSASSVERIEAFIKLGRPDPAPYADTVGPVSWEIAKFHVETILEQHTK